MSNKMQRNRKRAYAQDAINYAAELAAERAAQAAALSEAKARATANAPNVARLNKAKGGYTLAGRFFQIRAKALRFAALLGFSHVTGSGAPKPYRVSKIAAQYCAA